MPDDLDDRVEIIAFHGSAERRFAPSTERRIDLTKLYRRPIRQVATLNRGQVPSNGPQACPFALGGSLSQDWTGQMQVFRSALASDRS
jgi:hypothetical protein